MEQPEKINRVAGRIIQYDKRLRITYNPIYNLFAGISIYMMVIPLLILDVCTWWYQQIYFSIHAIPKIRRSEYVIIDRWKLPGLSMWVRFNCAYCDYANGVIAWAREVISTTEIYSCAIKNSTSLKGQEHTANYYEREIFR